jgi:WD40 repeat protein
LLPSRYSPEISLISLKQTRPRATQDLSLSTGATGTPSWADFSRDSQLLVTTGSDSVHLLEIEEFFGPRAAAESPPSARVFPGMSSAVRLVRLSADTTQLATVAGDGIIRIWRLDTAKLLEAAERVVGRNLTLPEWQRYFPGISYHKTFANLPGPPLQLTLPGPPPRSTR